MATANQRPPHWPKASDEDPELGAKRMHCVADKVHRAILSLCSHWPAVLPLLCSNMLSWENSKRLKRCVHSAIQQVWPSSFFGKCFIIILQTDKCKLNYFTHYFLLTTGQICNGEFWWLWTIIGQWFSSFFTPNILVPSKYNLINGLIFQVPPARNQNQIRTNSAINRDKNRLKSDWMLSKSIVYKI